MLLRCVNPFGNCTLGDEVEVPDGAIFDTAHFEVASDEAEKHDGKDETGKPDASGVDEKPDAKEGK